MTTALLVYITVPDHEIALYIAAGLVENRLAAGVNVAGPVESVYRWQGEVRNAPEWQVFVQTNRACLPKLTDWVRQHHPHQVPCVIAAEISGGYAPFLDWISRSSSGIK